MRLKIRATWLQNLFVFVCLAGIGWALFRYRLVIESIATPSLFFILVGISALLLVLLLAALTFVESRAEALTSTRTSGIVETQKFFIELYQNSPIPYLIVTYSGHISYPNTAARKLFGLEKNDLMDRNVFEMFQMAGEDELDRSVIFARFNNGVFVDDKEIIITRPDGSERHGLLSIFSYGGIGQKKKGLMTIVDVTKQKEIETSQSTFISLASHQLRTPISALQWNLELLGSPETGTLNQAQAAYLKKLINNVKKVKSLIQDFLNISKLELKTRSLQLKEFLVADFFTDSAEQFIGEAVDKSINLITDPIAQDATFSTDLFLLQMITSNLVSNAIKYTPAGGEVRVTVTVSPHTLTLQVSDTGMGIPAAEVEKIGTKFFRAHNAKDMVADGSGLGVYIVQLAVNHLQGDLAVESQINAGSVFTVTIPRLL